MKQTDILEGLGSKFELPVGELVEARAQLDALAPTFLDLLDRAVQDEQLSAQDSQRMFFGVHLMGEAGDTRLYRPFIRLLTEHPDAAACEFGEALVYTGPGILINVADKDPEPLLTLARQTDIEYPTGDAFRSLAVGAYAYLVATGHFDADAAKANLADLGETFEYDIDMSTAHAWITAVAALGFSDLVERARQRMRDDPAGAPIFSVEEIDELVEHGKTLPAAAVLAGQGFAPLENMIKTMAGWHGFTDEGVQERIAEATGAGFDDWEDDDWEDEVDPFLLGDDDPLAPNAGGAAGQGASVPGVIGTYRSTTTQINPHRDVGRNDPCPCGSGKKYKKCCLE